MVFSADAKAVIALTTRLGDPKRPALSPTRFHTVRRALQDAGLSLADLFADPAAAATLPPELADTVRDLVRGASAATVAAAELDNHGIWTMTVLDDDYPSRFAVLGDLAPPVIFGVGDRDTLASGGVAVVGSRDVSEAGGAFATAVAQEVARLGHTVMSGAARGVDQLAMNAAYSNGGRVVGILADSLQSRIRKAEMLAALDSGMVTLITQQSPTAGFSVGAAMGRNKLIYALAHLTVVVAAAHGSGGTWSGAEEALSRSYGRVAVLRGDGEGPGNAALVDLGGTPIRNPGDLAALLGGAESASPAPTEQLSILEAD